jgi:hypothetical protein
MSVKILLKLSEAEAKLKEAIASFGDDAVAYLTATDVEKGPAPLMAIKATAGLGKTHNVIKELLSYNLLEHGDVHYFVPNHKLSQQLLDDLNDELTLAIPSHNAVLQRARIIAGRSKKNSAGQPLCPKHQLANRLAAAGKNVYSSLCKSDQGKCEFFNGCGYREQLDEVDSLPKDEMFKVLTEVKVMTHEHMFLGTQSRFMQPGLIVIDEGFVTKAFHEMQVPLIKAIRFVRPDSFLYEICQMMANGEQELLKKVREICTPDELLIELERVLADERRDTLDLDINAPLASQEASVGRLEANNMKPLIETLAEEMRLTTRNESHAIVCSSDGVLVLRRKELQIPDVPVLIIDADADPALLELYFGRKVDLVDIPVERLAEIHQFKDRTFSKTSLLKADDGALLKDVESFVERVSPSGATLVVASKDVRKALSGEVDLELPADIPFAGATLAHFNSLRGVNRYSDYQNIVIVGREQPSTTGLEQLARALWWDAEEPLKLLEDKSGSKPFEPVSGTYWVQDGTESAKTHAHPDQRADALLRQIREAESVQAIDRLRLLRPSKSGLDRRIFILSSLPLDLRLDYLWSWDSLKESQRIVRACDGIVPLNAEHLRKADTSLNSKRTAENRVAEFKAARSLIDILISEVAVFSLRYKTPKQRRWSEALVTDNHSLEAVQARLTALAGQPVAVELVDVSQKNPL